MDHHIIAGPWFVDHHVPDTWGMETTEPWFMFWIERRFPFLRFRRVNRG